MTARNAGGAGSLPGLPESQSPSCDPSREGRPGRVGGSGRGGQAVTSSPPPGGSTRCSLLASAAGWGGDSGRRSERRTEGLRRREAAPPPSSCSAAGPARRGGPTSVPRAVAGASSGAAGPRPCLRAARSEWPDPKDWSLQDTDAFVLVYDICSPDSFDYVKALRQRIAETRWR
ncbi:ras-like protein family member 10A isoform X2 [Bubalus bubalis]|uniref:ras-like protein family member 10A isoform X2 n=1 Tax=Bubalus bubalis TaxID=89462 RepID=UPI001D11D54A|nr:ras-like protein family member 10A isoform X2 [Bubalus bubalis]